MAVKYTTWEMVNGDERQGWPSFYPVPLPEIPVLVTCLPNLQVAQAGNSHHP